MRAKKAASGRRPHDISRSTHSSRRPSKKWQMKAMFCLPAASAVPNTRKGAGRWDGQARRRKWARCWGEQGCGEGGVGASRGRAGAPADGWAGGGSPTAGIGRRWLPAACAAPRTRQPSQLRHALGVGVAGVQQQQAPQVLCPHKALLGHLQLPVAQRQLAQLAPLGLAVCASRHMGSSRVRRRRSETTSTTREGRPARTAGQARRRGATWRRQRQNTTCPPLPPSTAGRHNETGH